jgi:hypothetical protein
MILDSPIISGSLTQQAGQTAEIPRYTAVSSSFLAASASFDARIDSIESTTASFSPRINALESFTASANATYVNVSGDSMSGDLIITGSLIVTDRITAQEFHTEYVSSSIVFQSGSTKFGDSGDDVHSFTGSLKVDGTVVASNLNGIFSSSAQLTSSLGDFFIISGTITQTTWDNIASKPGGIVSGSSQVISLLPTGVVSGSSQITYSSISSIPVGIVSGAMQVTESLDVRYRLVGDDITFAELTFKPTLISGSSQLDGTTIQNLSGSFSGSFSGSYKGDGSQLTGLAAGAKFHTQSEPASTWTFVHNLSTQYPNVTVYGSNNNIILPQSINATNANTLVLEFGTPVSGYATAGVGGTIEVNGRTIKQYFSSSLSWRFEHNIGDRFVSIQTYDSGYEKIIPQTIALTDTTSSLITFPEATEGWAIGTIGGDLPAISSSFGGYVLQVSAGAPYTASWTAAANVTVTNSLTASHLNPISQSLIPAVSGTYDLGSQSNPWKHIYVGTGSIYLVDNSGTIVKTLTGDTIVTNDNLSSLNAFTASNFTTNTFTSSTLARLDSIEIVSASNITRIDDIESFTSSTTARVSSLEEKSGSLATTGSNTFFGTQTFSGSVYIKENLIVQGSSSLQNITASAVDIGTNKIILNVDNPSVRYAGISVYDSGSTGGTGSLWWDSVENHWLYEHPSDSAAPYNSAILISGPKNEGNLGEELELVNNFIVKSVGGDHISSSAIYDDGNIVKIQDTTLNITGSKVGIGITNPSSTFHALVAEEQSGLNSVRIQGITNNKLIALGVNTDYTWIQSHGSVPLYINELGNNTIFNLSGGRVGIGMTNPTSKLNVLVDGGGNGDGITLGVGSQGDGIQIVQRYLSNRVVATLGQSNYSGATDSAALRLYDVGGTETIRLSGKTNVASFINSGNIGVGTTNPLTTFTVKSTNDNGYALTRPTDGSVYHWRLSTTDTGGDAYSVRYNTFNNEMLFTTYAAGGTGGNVIFRTSSSGGAGSETERLRITSGGLVGIGTSSPDSSMLHINGGGTRGLRIDVNSGTQAISINPNGIFGIDEPGVGNGRFTINTNGRVGIGITNPSHKLSVSGDFYTSGTQENAGGYYYAQGSTILRKTLNITEGVTTTLLSFDQGGSYGHTGGGEILVVFVDPGSPWGVYVWKGLLTIRTVQFTGAYYGSNLSVIATNSTIDGSFDISATFSKTNGLANGEVRVRVVPGSGIGGTAYVYWNGMITQGGNAY